ncbi:DUF2187 family protein [Desertibacillus haloalkaliphilus]|uniref:DUF2187 family protein n=1 Tax=Desertibacillus haloalkaliphilus TaxID=1328930 RepID=UPI001C274488|nr:DUF2187 family protein [Desertibacillus haloalkaliphilus]MBU8907940.1 DUF2187 family protein [Desertibacillus haloalkaliphilus]
MSDEQLMGVEVGDIIQINKGSEKGQTAKVIAVYTNSVAIELNRKEDNGKPARTVINKSKFTVKS